MTSIEKKAEELLIKMFNDNPVKITQFSVLMFGNAMFDANCETMTIKQEQTIADSRYLVTVTAKLKKVKSVKKIIQ